MSEDLEQKTEEVSSDYFYDGKEINTSPRRGRPLKAAHHNPNWFPQQTKIDACTLYCVYGDIDEVSKLTKVPAKFLREWKEEPWWNEIQKKVYVEQNEKLGSRISSVLDKSLTHIEERLENGDYLWDVRKSKFVRKPVDTKILSNLFNNLVNRRQLIRGEPTSITTKLAVDDRLRLLAEQFEKFAGAKEVEAIPTTTFKEIEDGYNDERQNGRQEEEERHDGFQEEASIKSESEI
jgi:hypothetical protein